MPFIIDEDVENADWIKKTWDILPAKAETLLKHLRVDKLPLKQKRTALRIFMERPVARSMPESLKKELKDMGILK